MLGLTATALLAPGGSPLAGHPASVTFVATVQFSRSAVPVFFTGDRDRAVPVRIPQRAVLRHHEARRLTVEARAVLRRNQLGRYDGLAELPGRSSAGR